MRPGRKGSRLLVDSMLAGKFGDEVGGNELAYLMQDGKLRPGRFAGHGILLRDERRVVTQENPASQTGSYSRIYGMAVA